MKVFRDTASRQQVIAYPRFAQLSASIFNLIQSSSSTTLKMDVGTYSETSVTNYQSTRRHAPEDLNLH